MLYINQRKYPDMPYQHNLKHGGAPADKSNISSAGCGLCCLCMVVENMTMPWRSAGRWCMTSRPT